MTEQLYIFDKRSTRLCQKDEKATRQEEPTGYYILCFSGDFGILKQKEVCVGEKQVLDRGDWRAAGAVYWTERLADAATGERDQGADPK